MSNEEILNRNNSPPPLKKKKMNKTPISILTELCTQKKVCQPSYEELDQNDMTKDIDNLCYKFYIKCTAFGKSAVAGGVTKKGAKHSAAEVLLKKINQMYDSDSSSDDEKTTFCNNDYVSELLNLCVQKNFHKPDFVITESYGPSHAPTFTYACRLDSIVRHGTYSKKCIAKQLAAKNVLDILKTAYPDVEKKVMLINDENMAKEEARRKITTYMELKKHDKTDKMGTLISDRHNFFVEYKDEEFVASIKKVLMTPDLDLMTKYSMLVYELKKEWENVNVRQFADTGLKMFEIIIDFDQFTVNLVAKKEELMFTVVDYFMNMLHLMPKKVYKAGKILTKDDVILTPLSV